MLLNYQQLLLDLHIENQRYNTAIRLLNDRSHLHMNQIQPRLENAHITEKEYYSADYWKEAIGQRLYLTLQRSTEDLVSNVDDTLQSMIEIKDRVIEALAALFPGEKFFNFEIREKSTEPSGAVDQNHSGPIENS